MRNLRPTPRHAALGGHCDRCKAPATVRVGKFIGELHEYLGQPHAVDSRELDLLFCDSCFAWNRRPLHDQGFHVLQAVPA
jgi:hypothetical protein